jgi:signal transduction histidine kinase
MIETETPIFKQLRLDFHEIKLEEEFFKFKTHNSMSELIDDENLQRNLARLEQLNNLSQIAASVGHEIRNPITTIKGFLQLLANKEQRRSEGQYISLMIEELDRASSIINEFLDIARHKPTHREEQNLNDIINVIYPLILADVIKLGHSIVVEKGDISNLYLDEKEIRQLIFNLVRNGLEAMETRGTLKIKTYSEENEIILEITDQGKGLDLEILKKLGTPFVTTKEKGTGLGMAISYDIAERHDAKINVKTSTSGTTFIVRFKKS